VIRACSALFLGVFAVYLSSPIATPADSRWTINTALSLIHERNTDLNEYTAELEAQHWYAIECLLPNGQRVFPVTHRDQCPNGRFYHFYPAAVPLLASAAVAPLEAILSSLQPFAARVAPGPRQRFLAGDLARSSMMTELVLASALVAAAAVIVFLFAAELTGWPVALAATLIFAFATPAWSTGSRALWMHGFSMLLLPAGLWAIWRGRWALAGSLLLLAFFVRPTNLAGLLPGAALALWAGRAALRRFTLGALPIGALFALLNFATYGSLLAPYFLASRANAPSLGLHAEFGLAIAGNLFSPARGLFVYSPVLLLSAAGLAVWLRSTERRPLALFIAAAFVVQLLLVSSYQDWSGGHCYGPRYLSDLAGLLVLPLVALTPRLRVIALPLLAVSLFLHYQGAFCVPCSQWNFVPTEIRESPQRLWDWNDPPFLR